MDNIVLVLRPGAESISWKKFCQTHPAYSIALDGYVAGVSRFCAAGPRLTLDHHADVDRLATRATCAQVLLSLRQGLWDSFRDAERRRATVYANDCDEDVCLSWFLLQHWQASDQPAAMARLARLVQTVDLLDTTAGASLPSIEEGLLEEIAWIYEPYRQARLRGKLDRASASAARGIVDAVTRRTAEHLAGRGGALPLDTRYLRLGGVRGWSLVREIGPQARLGLAADGIRAYVSFRPLEGGDYAYVVGRASPFIPFDVPAILLGLNEAEEPARGAWGGGNLVGGSPRREGSALHPTEVMRIVNRVVTAPGNTPGRSRREPLAAAVCAG